MKIKLRLSTGRHLYLGVLFAFMLIYTPAVNAALRDPDVATQLAEYVKIKGVVKDVNGDPLIGATVLEKDAENLAITDSDGRFSIDVKKNSTLVISYMGFSDRIIHVKENDEDINVVLEENSAVLQELVVVGYGTQKKESVVGSISTVKSDAIMQSGGVSSVGQALQGKIPGVVTMFTNGEPGSEDLQIYIRGTSSWNSSGSPLILVDGVERSMSDVNMNDIESISVLKDASATAVYGVRGANGVILLTTKRGESGKPKLSLSFNSVMKTISKVPEKYDAYDAMMVMNESIMREVAYMPASWDYITPVQVAELYRNQQTQEELEMYPNVDWLDFMYKDVAVDYNVDASVRGGNKFAKYFCSIGYLNESDIVKKFDTGRGYNGGMSYQRFNYRANIDMNLTKTTKLSIGVSGIYSLKVSPDYADNSASERMFVSLYNVAPDLYYPLYSDGSFGYSPIGNVGLSNSLRWYYAMGKKTTYNFKINADVSLDQKLDFITKGLSASARFSMDNTMTGMQSIYDRTGISANVVEKCYDIKTGEWIYNYPQTNSDYEYAPAPWVLNEFTVGSNKKRLIDYQLGLHYDRTFADKHTVTGLFLFRRQEYASGNMFPSYNEDWVFRATYDYDRRYLIELNGAYNGSEQFGPGYRFDLFPSVGLGWVLSNEKFMRDIAWIDRIKLRASAGLVGDDNFTSARWLYMSQWESMNYYVPMANPQYFGPASNLNAQSPYMTYEESILGNEDIHWETSFKRDYGLEFSFLNGAVRGEFDYFLENRKDIYIKGADRAMNDFLGITPPGANLGKVNVHGYEVVLNLSHNFDTGVSMYADLSYTHAKDRIIFADDPELKPAYQKKAGFPIGQTHSAIQGDMMQSWDDVYMSTPLSDGDNYKRIGYYDIVDFNGDGKYYDVDDNVPYQYPTRPQNTWTATLGGEFKGFSFSVQFFGQFNSTRNYVLNSFTQQTHIYFKAFEDYWSKENSDGKYTLAPVSLTQAASDPYRNLVDASIVRLKMVEVGYSLPPKALKKIGLKGLKVFFNGNNLYLWTDMADDRDYGGGSRGAYPTLRHFNFGINIDL